MEQQKDHGLEKKSENPLLAAGRWRVISTVLFIGLIIVLSDLSYFQGGMAKDLPDRSGNDVWVSESGKIEFRWTGDNDFKVEETASISVV